MKQESLFKCEFCGRASSCEAVILDCERRCLEMRIEAKKRHVEFKRKCDERTKQATDWAIQSQSVRLLVANGFFSEARLVCSDWAHWNLWDCGTSHGWEELLDGMVKAAKEAHTTTGGSV